MTARGHGPLGRLGRLVLLLVLAAAPALAAQPQLDAPAPASGPAPADTSVGVIATLAPSRESSSAVWDGQNAYIFGGFGDAGHLRDILRFDTELVTMGAQLPQGTSKTSAVWTGDEAYIFGGSIAGATYTDAILRYRPDADQLTTMGAKLPSARGETSAVWSGQYAYIFGGAGGDDEIVRYDPAADAVMVMGARLPLGSSGTSAVWMGGAAYVFGGLYYESLDPIVKYDPVSDTATTVGHLPAGAFGSSAVVDGDHALVFGGESLDTIVRFTPATGAVAVEPLRLPSPRSSTSAVMMGGAAYVFGGCCGSPGGDPPREIVQYAWAAKPGPPRDLQPQAAVGASLIGTSVGLPIHLSWQSPADDGGAAVIKYRVGWSTHPQGPWQRVCQVQGTSCTHAQANPLTPNYYRVSAVNGVGEGTPSATVCAFTYPWALSSLLAPPGGGCPA